MTNKEYMSDRERVFRVVDKFRRVALKEFRGGSDMSKKQYKYIADGFLSYEGIDPEKYDKLTYLDLVCLLDYMGDDDDRCDDYLLCMYCLASLVIEAEASLIPVRMFTALPICALARYAQEMDLYYYSSDLAAADVRDLTVKEYLAKKMDECRRVWLPGGSVGDYTKKIIKAHRDIGEILVGMFRIIYSMMFDAEYVIEKCRAR